MWHCLYLLFTLRVGVQGFEEYLESSVCHIWQVQVSFPAATSSTATESSRCHVRCVRPHPQQIQLNFSSCHFRRHFNHKNSSSLYIHG